jgi:hypothetical protein
MPIRKMKDGLECKSNGVKREEDDWKPFDPNSLKLNEKSDQPNKDKDQVERFFYRDHENVVHRSLPFLIRPSVPMGTRPYFFQRLAQH